MGSERGKGNFGWLREFMSVVGNLRPVQTAVSNVIQNVFNLIHFQMQLSC